MAWSSLMNYLEGWHQSFKSESISLLSSAKLSIWYTFPVISNVEFQGTDLMTSNCKIRLCYKHLFSIHFCSKIELLSSSKVNHVCVRMWQAYYKFWRFNNMQRCTFLDQTNKGTCMPCQYNKTLNILYFLLTIKGLSNIGNPSITEKVHCNYIMILKKNNVERKSHN